MTMRAIKFGGTVLLGKLNTSKTLASGIRKVGNVYPLNILVSTETAVQTSALKESHGQSLHAAASISGVEGDATFREYDAQVLAWALAGEAAQMTETGGTESDKSITLISGEWVELGNRMVSSVVITGSVIDVDFEVNETLGLIRMIPDGNLTAGANSVSYSYAAQTDYQIKIGTQAQNRFYTLLDGMDLETGADFHGVFDSVVWRANTSVPLISDPTSNDFGEMPMDLIFETLTGKDCPGVINGIPLNLY